VNDQKPSVGRVVHYVAYGTPGGEFPAGVCRAATITEVDKPNPGNPGEVDGPMEDPGAPRVGLFIANPTGCFFNQHVPYSAEPKPGSWHWPRRVEDGGC